MSLDQAKQRAEQFLSEQGLLEYDEYSGEPRAINKSLIDDLAAELLAVQEECAKVADQLAHRYGDTVADAIRKADT